MTISISSRRVPSNYAAQEKTLNAAGSKVFLGVVLPVNNLSRMLGVIWARNPLSFSGSSTTLRALSFLLDPNILSARGVRLVAGVKTYIVLSSFMAFWMV